VEDRVLFDVADWAKIACENSGIGYLGATVVPKPEAYVEGEIDIAGTVVGVIDKKNLITGERIEEGDVIVGISTDCLMTNGLSMARRLTEAINRKHGWDYDTPVEALGGKSQRDEILKPHTFYTDIMFGAWGVPGVYSHFGESIRGTAHITGDGQPGNINRMIPDGLCAVVEKEVLPIPPLMRFYMDEGANVEEMWETFNMGVGMSFIMPESAANQFIKHVEYNFQHGNEHTERKAKIIGRIEKSPDGKKYRWAA
jgi:phosphoribosylformylglycinamidine cyclo-ligase